MGLYVAAEFWFELASTFLCGRLGESVGRVGGGWQSLRETFEPSHQGSQFPSTHKDIDTDGLK